MSEILQLFDPKFTLPFLRQKLLPLYPGWHIKAIEIIPHKKNIWPGGAYHVVIEFRTTFQKDGQQIILPIFCSAHSHEPRRNVYMVLKYLWQHGFGSSQLVIPRPLFYSQRFRATFYRGIEGRNLYYFIRNQNLSTIKQLVPQAARWFAKLHAIVPNNNFNFNRANSRIRTVIPGYRYILERIKSKYPQHYPLFKRGYQIFIEAEEKFLNSTSRRWLVHGDAHPENIIKISKQKIGVIDFTDFCLSDFARDLGSFKQQLEFMCCRKISSSGFCQNMEKLFLSSYFKAAGQKLTSSLEHRINIYYYWTALRTVGFLLMKDNPDPTKAKPLIQKLRAYLNNYVN